MRLRLTITLLLAVAAGCGSRLSVEGGEQTPLTAERKAGIEQDVRAYAQLAARDLANEGPSAWRKHFEDSSSFFMAADGHLEYPDSAAATRGITDLSRTIKSIELHWGKDLRVDPLTPDLAVLASSWREVLVTGDGGRVNASGYFTGLVEHNAGHWQFRNAHWSIAHPDPPRPVNHIR